MRVHAFAPHFMSKCAIPHLRKNERADIVMISSVATLSHAANGAPYNMGKAAAEALAQALESAARFHGSLPANVASPELFVARRRDLP